MFSGLVTEFQLGGHTHPIRARPQECDQNFSFRFCSKQGICIVPDLK